VVFYREGNTVQTSNISNDGYTNVTLGADVLQYDITRLPPFTNYTIHVRAQNGDNRPGEIDTEVLNRTHSAADTDIPTAPPTATPISPPTSNEITILIGDPREIDTGIVM